jgi:hypothetical protein
LHFYWLSAQFCLFGTIHVFSDGPESGSYSLFGGLGVASIDFLRRKRAR